MSENDTTPPNRTVYQIATDAMRAPSRIRIGDNTFSVVGIQVNTDAVTDYWLVKRSRFSQNPWILQVKHDTCEVSVKPIHHSNSGWEHVPSIEIVEGAQAEARMQHDETVDPLGLNWFQREAEVAES